jgi:hypothetical protein
VNLGKSIERPASRSAGHLISFVEDVVHAGRNALILRAELRYMTNALLNSMSKSVSTDGSILRNTGDPLNVEPATTEYRSSGE